MRFQGFIGPSYTLGSLNVDCQRCINLYPEINETGRGKENEVASLVGTPGLSLLLTTAAAGPIRGTHAASNGQAFVVSANKLYRISSAWVATELGTLSSTTGPVSMADNGTYLMIVDGDFGYTWNINTSTFATISDPDFPGADQVTYQDGYFIFNWPATGKFMITDLNGVGVDALDFATAEGAPDDLVGLISDHRDLWLFGSTSVEVFFNSGNADFPFERVQGAYIEHGCAAAFSIAKMNNSVYWLGKDSEGHGIVYTAQGYQPQRISTHAVEQAIQSYGDISDASAYTYQDGGHFFYVLNFSSANTTWVFDSSTNLWHERAYFTNGQFERHRADNHMFAHNKHVVGDYQNGKIYELSKTTYSDNGAAIVRRRVSPHVSADMDRVFYKQFQLDIETGVGIDGSGQGDDPQAILEFSDDGGHSWSNEKWTGFGAIGNRKSRAIWRRLGQARDRVFRVTITDPVKVTLIGADLELDRGAS